MSRHFEPDPTDKRDTIDQRCINCGFPFGDHYNSKCPDDEAPECWSGCEDPYCPYTH